MARARAEKIDAHHHLWRYAPDDYGWIDESMKSLRRDFLVSDLETELQGAGLDGAVTVQARQSLEETEWLLSLSASPAIRGVIGWAPITSERFSSELERLQAHKKLKGLRHVIQDEPDPDFINRPDFNRGIATLHESGLVYDILIYDKHLKAAIQFVDRHPRQAFVLDHLAKPRIREGALEPWRRNISELARRANVCCKLSGLVTEANWTAWKEDDLAEYVEVVLEAFGAQRVMVGSDWPVCLLATTYGEWFRTVDRLIGSLSSTEQDRIRGGTAVEVYRLQN